MTSKVLDLATMAHALNELCREYLGDCMWVPESADQREFLHWYNTNRDEIDKLDSLTALASPDYEELNAFLVERGFEPMFEPLIGVGVASILDMLVEWAIQGVKTDIGVYDPSLQRVVSYPAFEIEAGGADVYDVVSWEHPLVRLHTVTGHSLWLMKADEPSSGLELNEIAQGLLTWSQYHASAEWKAGVRVPMLEINTKADLSWMVGFGAVSPAVGGELRISQAFQQFKLRANDIGARVKVATGFGFECMSVEPEPYELNAPFIGFFTQPGHDKLPLAAFWADTDSWRSSGEALEEL